MQELQELWEKVLLKMQNRVTALYYSLWISTLEPIDLQNDTLLLCAVSISAKRQILDNQRNNNAEILGECIKEIFGDNVKFEIFNKEEKEKYLEEIKHNENINIVTNETKKQFNEKYTFDNFVVGKSNQFCYAAAHAVAEAPGRKFNPLFIYSGVGLGKTHLMHAIGNYLTEYNPELKIKYVTCEKFMNEYIDSLGIISKDKAIFEFREKYRNVDVLMIDDIQQIANKDATKEEFFHTFNDLYQNNKQIIITSDRSPVEIDVEDRLKSRFSCGLIQDMQIPDFETKMAILKKKAQLEKFYLDDNVITYIAEKPFTNIREMEGMLSKIFFYATLMGKKSATMEDAEEAFKENVIDTQKNQESTALSPEKIISTVCEYFGLTKAEITSKKKSKDIVEPRMIAIYLITDLLNISQDAIGKLFGGKDHSTIIHARDKVTDLLKKDNKTKSIVNDLKSRLN